MSKKAKIIIGEIVFLVLVVVIGVLLGLRSKPYKFDLDNDNSFIEQATEIEIYNANSAKKYKEVTKTIEVEWAEANNSSESSVKKDKIVVSVKDDSGKEYYLTEGNYVYTKSKNKFTLLKSKVSKLGLYEGKAIVEVSDKVYYIEVKNGKYVIDNELQLEVIEQVEEVEELVLPQEASLNKNIKNKLVFNDKKEVSFENGDELKEKDTDKNITVLYALYVANGKESRFYIIADSMKLFVISDNRLELESVTKVSSVLVNAKGVEVDTEDGKLVFEKK